MFFTEADITTDPQALINRSQAKYYGVLDIKLEKDIPNTTKAIK